jgi:hypothetical protein
MAALGVAAAAQAADHLVLEGTVTLQSVSAVAGVPWEHVLSVTTPRSPFAGRATHLWINVPRPLRGRLVFEAQEPLAPAGTCGRIARGFLSGRIAGSFHGFGAVRRSFSKRSCDYSLTAERE